MLKHLHIQNIILIESATIDFQPGFNVLSGETGAGKSAIIEALGLITGTRADHSLIRKGAERGIAEATFDIEPIPEMASLLVEAGIDHFDGEDLIIRREIHRSGKSRAFINNQLAHLGLLRKVGNLLIGIVSQHAHQHLLSVEQHRRIVDLFGNLAEEANQFAEAWEKESQLRQSINELINNERQRLREIETCRMELEELKQANLKEGEEEELFHEYTLLSNREDLSRKTHEITQALQGEKNSILQLLNRQLVHFDSLVRIDSHFSEIAETYRNALIELQEVAYSVQNYHSHLEYHPQRTAEVDERLSLINRLKRRYGNSVAEILDHRSRIEERLQQLENADEQIERLQTELKIMAERNNEKCAWLTNHRKEAAKQLERAMIKQLRSLNMPKVEFQIELLPQKRSRHGDEAIQFYLLPNVGEEKIAIKDCASGGELSRVMLALQTLLAGKEQLSTLVFDEIDANIGGATASIVGNILREIGSKHQVLCITHFSQVAKFADHHFEISKQEREGRTLTFVQLLNDQSRLRELSRMQGETQKII